MKKNGLLMILLFSLIAVSCSEDSSSGGSDDSSSDDGGSVSIDGGTGTDGGGTGTTGGSCLASGTGSGNEIYGLELFMAGHQSWMPGTYSNSLASSTMPTIEEAGYLFRSDGRLQVKFRVNSQPSPTAGEEYCYGRATGQASDAFKYTKLRFRFSLRDIKCDTPHPTDPAKCSSQFYLGSRYQIQYTQPINVDSCSSVIDLSSKRNITQYGTVVEVDDVKSDSDCQYGYSTYNCPSEKIVRAASCWNISMQVVTDFTKDF